MFLTKDRVLKIKRAVRFPFLDYSTLARRRTACEQELEVNRRFAPQIYRRVVPITRSAGGILEIGGDGEPIEWAVEMARFDERLTLDHLARQGPLTPGLVAALAEVIAQSHRVAPSAATEPWLDSIEPIIADNTAAFTAGEFADDEVATLDRTSREALSRHRRLLGDRGARGFVRWCHGDLHLANIVLIDGKPVLFDAIEFDPVFASVDVAYDLAFPLMDLLRYGRGEAAAGLLSSYLAATGDDSIDALAALPLLQSIRAAIRAKVLLMRPAKDETERQDNRHTAESYFALALRLITPPQPRLIAVGGLSGTGKSVLARSLAAAVLPLPGAVVLRSDVVRKQTFGVAETARLGADAYTPEVTAKVYGSLAARAASILGQGHSVIVDAVFARGDERRAIEAIAAKAKVPFEGVYLTADLAIRIARVEGRLADASDATADIVRQQQAYQLDSIDWHKVDASGTPQQTLERALAATKISDQTCST
ncbi:bifunctional aminoglycoside phosphotransferase/ATP-binding protein [Rhodopseudomonas sp. B29]|uniref:bifunctional aminoglycoside phosphotransferase/ATP-binding protein n=1 Tax=Rhodopseudomonas sp. B29 TaxID=95607 RepID=UPI00034A8D4B|nr:bifunctional aminoglycoside phosphotransferase/ATP-binding protein [Rhodopseudomonas sp. B29]